MIKISQQPYACHQKTPVSVSNLHYKIALKMETTMIQPTLANAYAIEQPKQSLFAKFIIWCAGQERNRFGWLGAALGVHGCVTTPLALFAIVLSGNHIALWAVALVAMGATLVTNLSAMPTKITIPVFLSTVLIDLAIIIACAATGFNWSVV